MLLELNDLSHIIIGKPPATLMSSAAWDRICAQFNSAFIVEATAQAEWTSRLDDVECVVLAWDDNFSSPVQGNIARALDVLGAQPYDTEYVSFDVDDLREAINTRVGTAQVAGPLDEAIADVYLSDLDAAVDLLETRKRDVRLGYVAESSVDIRGRPLTGQTQILTQRGFFVGKESIATTPLVDVDLVILGRYFPVLDARHGKHQLSKRILKMKDGDPRGDCIEVPLGRGIAYVCKNMAPVHLITRVPPKPSKHSDNVGRILNMGCVRADGMFQLTPTLQSRVDLDLVRCIREYGAQKDAGSHQKRAANVRGAFAVTRHLNGEHVLLIDDVITSGSTAAECATILLSSGASRVTVLAIAMTQKIITSMPRELPCQNDCPGHMRMQFNGASPYGAFWGCSEYFRSGCIGKLDWAEGLRQHNRLNTRDTIPSGIDIEF